MGNDFRRSKEFGNLFTYKLTDRQSRQLFTIVSLKSGMKLYIVVKLPVFKLLETNYIFSFDLVLHYAVFWHIRIDFKRISIIKEYSVLSEMKRRKILLIHVYHIALHVNPEKHRT